MTERRALDYWPNGLSTFFSTVISLYLRHLHGTFMGILCIIIRTFFLQTSQTQKTLSKWKIQMRVTMKRQRYKNIKYFIISLFNKSQNTYIIGTRKSRCNSSN